MKEDPAIDSIRRTRHEISKRFGHNTKALVDHYKMLQEKYTERLAAETPTASTPSDGRMHLDGRPYSKG